MKSNDIIVEYKIGDKARAGLKKIQNIFRGKDYNPQDPDGLNKGDPKFGYPDPETPETNKEKTFTLPRNNNSSSRQANLARKYFVENFVETVYDLVAGQLKSPQSYIAKPGKTIDEKTQVSLDTYLSNWYNQYTDSLKIEDGTPFGKLKNNLFIEMQKQWDKGIFDTSLLANLAEQTYAYAKAGAASSAQTAPNEQYSSTPQPESKPVTESEKRVEKLKKLLEK
jgi:hypothetical protein